MLQARGMRGGIFQFIITVSSTVQLRVGRNTAQEKTALSQTTGQWLQ